MNLPDLQSVPVWWEPAKTVLKQTVYDSHIRIDNELGQEQTLAAKCVQTKGGWSRRSAGSSRRDLRHFRVRLGGSWKNIHQMLKSLTSSSQFASV
jgi:hypothetical protein